MKYQNLNKLHAAKNDIVYLTNSLGEKNDNVDIPEAPYEWYENLEINSPSLLYLVNLKNNYGIMAINEFDSTTATDIFGGNYKTMRKTIRKNANCLCADELVGQYSIYIGNETGFDGCDEIAVFIPFDTKNDIVNKALNIIDNKIYAMN